VPLLRRAPTVDDGDGAIVRDFRSMRRTSDYLQELAVVMHARQKAEYGGGFSNQEWDDLRGCLNVLRHNGEADQRRTLDSVLPLDSIRRLIQRLVPGHVLAWSLHRHPTTG